MFEWPKVWVDLLEIYICIACKQKVQHTLIWANGPMHEPVCNSCCLNQEPAVLLKAYKTMAAYPWVEQLQSAMVEQGLGINQRASKVMAVLKEHGLCFPAKLLPRDLLVHPSNRGGQMVNGYDVVSKGQAICELGWDINKIREPVAFELPHSPEARNKVLEANNKLALQSGGMLPKPFGKERYCSVSASHTTCFLRCLEAGCVIGEGNSLSVEALVAKGDDLGKLLHEGWSWTVIAAKVEEEVPALPSLLQQALNSHLYKLP